jgi:hypothetical protein
VEFLTSKVELLIVGDLGDLGDTREIYCGWELTLLRTTSLIGMSLPIRPEKKIPPVILLAPRYPASIPNLAVVKWGLAER